MTGAELRRRRERAFDVVSIAIPRPEPDRRRDPHAAVQDAGTGTFESTNATLGATVVQDAALVLHAGRLSQGLGAFAGAIVDGDACQGEIHDMQ